MAEQEAISPKKLLQNEGELDIAKIISTLLKEKLILISTTFVAATLAIIISLQLPNVYRAEALLSPVNQQASSKLSGFAKTLGGLGGGLVENEISPTSLALEILHSRLFITSFIKRHNLLPQLMATEVWVSSDNSLVFDDSFYDDESKSWKEGKKRPTDWEAYDEFSKILSVNKNTDTGFITVSIDHISPNIASEWVTLLIKDLNAHSKQSEIARSIKSIDYLEAQLQNTNISEIKNILYDMIRQQVQKGLLAETREEFVLETVDPAIAPEKKIAPKRSIIVILSTIFGGLTGLLIIYMKYILRRYKA